MGVRFISAGAGSGKTYRLTELLYERLSGGQVQPSGVIATTFTRKAATELRERVRGALLERGDFLRATAMGQARIGTVNSVCGALVSRFAFEAGLSPTQRVVDDAQAATLVREAIDDVSDEAVIRKLVEVAQRLGIESWLTDLKAVMDAARANDIPPERVSAAGARNAGDLLAHFPPASERDLDQALIAAISEALPKIVAGADGTTKKTTSYINLLRDVLQGLKRQSATWAEWVKLSKAEPEAGLQYLAHPVAAAAGEFAAHPQLHRDIADYLQTLFAFAARALDAYAARKRTLAVLDFVDQERLLLALLDQPSVVETLAAEIDLLLVDEFQDTSPIQLELFVRLSRIAKEAIWVGDVKQAIYGFRGSDAELMAAVVDDLPRLGGTKEVLGQSRRSRPHLVNLVNSAFVPAFAPRLSPAEVVLSPVRPEATADAPLRLWTLKGKKAEERIAALAHGLRELIASGHQVVDRATGVPRPAHFGDVAVLARSNDNVQKVAAALRAIGVPWATQQPGLLATPEAVLAVACLRRLNDPFDTLATAEILSLAECQTAEEWLADRLRFLAAGGESHRWREAGAAAHPLIERLAALRPQLAVLAPSAALELVIAQCDLGRAVIHWGRDELVARVRLANLQALVALARTYEDTCAARSEPATVSGLIMWLDEQVKEGEDFLAEPPVAAVKVLTHHAAKGLEWPIVVLLDLEQEVKDRLWSVQARSEGRIDVLAPLRDRWIRYWPWPFGKQEKVTVADRIAESEEGVRVTEEAIGEAKRLLYVSMTRARDGLVIALPREPKESSWLGVLKAPWLTAPAGGGAVVQPPDGPAVPSVAQVLEEPPEPSPETTESEPLHWFPQPGMRQERLPAVVTPASAAPQACEVLEVARVGDRIDLAARSDLARLGNAVHAYLACTLGTAGQPDTEPLAERALAAFDCAEAIDARALMRQREAIDQWIEARWPAARRHCEVPVESVLPNGQVLLGRIDLLVETSEGWVVVDHKSNPAPAARWPEVAAEHAAQVFLYGNAVAAATERPVLESWILLPIAGGAVRIAAV